MTHFFTAKITACENIFLILLISFKLFHFIHSFACLFASSFSFSSLLLFVWSIICCLFLINHTDGGNLLISTCSRFMSEMPFTTTRTFIQQRLQKEKTKPNDSNNHNKTLEITSINCDWRNNGVFDMSKTCHVQTSYFFKTTCHYACVCMACF